MVFGILFCLFVVSFLLAPAKTIYLLRAFSEGMFDVLDFLADKIRRNG